jgi:hypothetical protein
VGCVPPCACLQQVRHSLPETPERVVASLLPFQLAGVSLFHFGTGPPRPAWPNGGQFDENQEAAGIQMVLLPEWRKTPRAGGALVAAVSAASFAVTIHTPQ